jgi:LmbE family N-acetylglucosaminyl deacetylase
MGWYDETKGDFAQSPARRIAVLSPHLDDAIFSLGAFVHQQTRGGAEVRIVTVLANDPASTLPEPGWWDRECGFASPAAAAQARREEDRRACEILGALPIWLPFGDETYGRGATDAVVWRALSPAIGGADAILVPGFPLSHPDHAWLTQLILSRREQMDASLALYAEQPYAAGTLLHEVGQERPQASAFGLVRDVARFAFRLRRVRLPPAPKWSDAPLDVEWGVVRPDRADWRAKRRAIRCYKSQVRPIGLVSMWGATLYEHACGGEPVAWLGR